MAIQENTNGIMRGEGGVPSEECCCVTGFFRLLPCVLACSEKCGDFSKNQDIIFVQANEFNAQFSGACAEAPNSKYIYKNQCYELSCTSGQTPSGDQQVVLVREITKSSANQSCADCCGAVKDTTIYCDCHGCQQYKLPCGVANAGGGGTVQTGQDLKFKEPGASVFEKCLKFIRNANAADASSGGAIDTGAITAGGFSTEFTAMSGDCLTDSDCVGAGIKPGRIDGCGIVGHCGCQYDCGDKFGPKAFGCGDAVGEVPSAVNVSVPPVEGGGSSHQCSLPCGVTDCDNTYCGGNFVVQNDGGFGGIPAGSECSYFNGGTQSSCPHPNAHVRAKFLEFFQNQDGSPTGIPPFQTPVPCCDACAGCFSGSRAGGNAPFVPIPPITFPAGLQPGIPISEENDPIGEPNGKLQGIQVVPRPQDSQATVGNCWEIRLAYMNIVRAGETGVPCGMIAPGVAFPGFNNQNDQGDGAADVNCLPGACDICDGTLREPHDKTACPCTLGIGQRNCDTDGDGCGCCGQGAGGDCAPADLDANIGCCDANPGQEFAWVGKKVDTSNDTGCPFGTYEFDMVISDHNSGVVGLPNQPFINTGDTYAPAGNTCGGGTTYTAVPPSCTAVGQWTGLTVTVE